MNNLSGAAKRLAPILAAAVGVRAAQNAANIAVEIGRLSQVANASTTAFRRFAIAAKTVGIERQKAADLLKDVNDRVGDFLVTGGGPMADFFEKVTPLVDITPELPQSFWPRYAAALCQHASEGGCKPAKADLLNGGNGIGRLCPYSAAAGQCCQFHQAG